MLEDSEVSIEDFLPVSKRDRDEMLEMLHEWIGSIVDDSIREMVSAIAHRHPTALRDAPAAKTNHQAYIGGLLEHILNLCELGRRMKQMYPILDLDLLVAAAVLHDIGKIWELKWDKSIDYTRRGRLTGHVVMGLQLFQDYNQRQYYEQDHQGTFGPLSPEKRDHLEHIIASHHGNKEWGAAQVPMSREAYIFHFCDMIDSRMGNFDGLADKPRDADGFTPYIQSMGGPIFVPKGEPCESFNQG